MNPNQTQNGPRLGNIPLTEDQFKQLSTLKTYADMGIPDSYLMPYFEQVMGQSFISPSDKSQQEMEDEAAKLQLYQLRKELGLDTSGLDSALGIDGTKAEPFDLTTFANIEELKKAVAAKEMKGEAIPDNVKRFLEFNDYQPDWGNTANHLANDPLNAILAASTLMPIANLVTTPILGTRLGSMARDYQQSQKEKYFGKNYKDLEKTYDYLNM